jgi:o-succinylbenzoate synthase
MKEKTSWFIKVWDNNNDAVYGMGECGPLPGLSPDYSPDFENILVRVLGQLGSSNKPDRKDALALAMQIVPPGYPSVLFGLETALLDLLNGGHRIIFDNGFIHGRPIPINGLVWMGDEDFMMRQVHEKIAQGFECIKLKVGGLDFDAECRLLESIRKTYPFDKITVRLDANGAFSTDEAFLRLNALSRFEIHSIEQPIQPGREEMTKICRESPIPIALDEELIGQEADKTNLLTAINPSFIILKPTLHGGMNHCHYWIEEATRLNIGWWITSALESNIGLNAIFQFTANYDIQLPQGLGTGSIYVDNLEPYLTVDGGFISVRDKL